MAIFEPKDAGHISPRGLVKAQQIIAQKNNCDLLDSIATKIYKPPNSNDFVIEAKSAHGLQQIHAKSVVLAVGAYVNMNSLIKDILPKDKSGFEPDLSLETQTVAYLQVSPAEAQRLRQMPSVVTNYHCGKLDGTYILPPILYPDGKHYLKLGHGDVFEINVKTPEQMHDWYAEGTGVPEAVEALADFIKGHFIPSLEVKSVHGGCCVTSNVILIGFLDF